MIHHVVIALKNASAVIGGMDQFFNFRLGGIVLFGGVTRKPRHLTVTV